MDATRQKIQLSLAFDTGTTSDAGPHVPPGVEPSTARRAPNRPASATLREEVCERENLKAALRRVRRNKGAAGIDGMTVEQLPAHLKEHWPAIRTPLLSGTYRPQPVRRVEIPKPDGGQRKLGIPTVLDRFIQQGAAGAATRLGFDIFRQQVRLSSTPLGPSGRGPRAGSYRGGFSVGRRY